MNRKQQIAVVVGALVIAGLAVFPPWDVTRMPRVDDFVQGAHPRIPQPCLTAPRWAFGAVPEEGKEAFIGPNYQAALCMQLAALALSVAAVIVLRERNAR